MASAIARTGIALLLGVALLGQATPRPARADPEPEALAVPDEGTAAERARKLWQASRPVILADAKANYPDAEYMKRRGPVWSAWTTLQMVTAGEDDGVSRLIPDVLRLLNDVYGWTADAPAKRKEIRDRARPRAAERVAEIDARVASLK